MIVGISLFVRLAQAVVRPYKGQFPLPSMRLAEARHRRRPLQGLRSGLLNITDKGD